VTNAIDTIDFFISLSDRDRAVAQRVAWILEAMGGYTTILQDWDFGSANFVAKMDDALARAGRLILLLSSTYLESAFCNVEWQALFAADPQLRA
jgi:hypothetical protein